MLNLSLFKKIIPLMTLPLSLSGLFGIEPQETEVVFTELYNSKAWGKDGNDNGTSGYGAKLETTDKYRAFLQEFIKTHQINTVVDVGCGYWDYMKALNWDGIEYYGYDAVQMVIEKNMLMNQTPSVNFIHADVITTVMPKADLMICKDVMQHLPLEDIQSILCLASDYKYCIIVNDIIKSPSFTNDQITKGEYRPLDLTKAPFNLKGNVALTYSTGYTTKQVFVIQN